jgi:hypothetical protein
MAHSDIFGPVTMAVVNTTRVSILFFGYLALLAACLAWGVVLIRRGRHSGWFYIIAAVLLLGVVLLPRLLPHRVY